MLRRTVDGRDGSIASFRAHRDRGCLPPTTDLSDQGLAIPSRPIPDIQKHASRTWNASLRRNVRGTSLFRNGPVGSWEHGSRANHELQALFVALTVAPSPRFSLSPEFCSRSPGSSAFAAGQVKRQVPPEAA